MKAVEVIVSVMLALILIPTRSDAYIDPGTGSFVLQMLVAAVLGVVFALKMYWQRLKTFFSRLAKKRKDSDDTGQP